MKWTRHSWGIGLAVLAFVAVTASLARAPIVSAVGSTSDCDGCQASAATLVVDPSSYKLWPSGSRTFLSVQWAAETASASFDIKNLGSAPSPELIVDVVVSNHDPLTQTPMTTTSYSDPIASLASGATATINVPLDPTQCDIFVSVDLGSGAPTVLRTGNPAAC
jgi:hypothetical protein